MHLLFFGPIPHPLCLLFPPCLTLVTFCPHVLSVSYLNISVLSLYVPPHYFPYFHSPLSPGPLCPSSSPLFLPSVYISFIFPLATPFNYSSAYSFSTPFSCQLLPIMSPQHPFWPSPPSHLHLHILISHLSFLFYAISLLYTLSSLCVCVCVCVCMWKATCSLWSELKVGQACICNYAMVCWPDLPILVLMCMY